MTLVVVGTFDLRGQSVTVRGQARIVWTEVLYRVEVTRPCPGPKVAVLRYVILSEAGQFRTVEGQAVTVKTEVVSCPPTVELAAPVTTALPTALEAPLVEAGKPEDTETPAAHATPALESRTEDSNRAKVVPGAARPEARSTQRKKVQAPVLASNEVALQVISSAH